MTPNWGPSGKCPWEKNDKIAFWSLAAVLLVVIILANLYGR